MDYYQNILDRDILLPHQISSIDEMQKKENNIVVNEIEGYNSYTVSHSKIGVLNNDIGTGKTKTAVNFVLNNIKNKNITKSVGNVGSANNALLKKNWVIARGNVPLFRDYIYCNSTHSNATLMIVPSNVINQWQEEIIQSCEARQQKIKLHVITPKSAFNKDAFLENDIILTAPSLLLTRMHNNPDYVIKFSRIVVDEPCTIKYNFTCNNINADFWWFVTATDMSLTNRSCYNFVKKYSLGQYLLYSKCLYIKFDMAVSNWKQYKKNIINYNLTSVAVINKLATLIDTPSILEMIDAGDFQTAHQAIGANIVSDNKNLTLFDVIKLSLLNKVNIIKKKLESNLKNNPKNKELEKELLYATKRCDNAEEILEGLKTDTCNVCMTDVMELEDPLITNCCGHLLCKYCLEHIKIPTMCCVCRTEPTTYTQLTKPKEHNTERVTKMQVIENIFRQSPFLKIVMYMSGTLDIQSNEAQPTNNIVERFSDICDIEILHGTQNMMKRQLEKFKSPNEEKCKVLILNKHSNAAGLNLQYATDLVIWNNTEQSIIEQIEGRLYRFGLDHDINIHYLF